MAERTLRLTVAASADRSLTSVIQPLVDSFERAKTKVAAGSKSMSDSMKGAAKDGADHLGKGFDLAAVRGQKAYKQIEEASAKAAVKEAADAAKSAQAKVVAEQKAFDERIKLAQKAATQKAAIAKREHDAEEKQILQDVRRHEAAEERKAAASERAAARSAMRDQRQRQAGAARDVHGMAREAGGTIMGLGRAAMGAASTIAGGMGVNFDVGSSIGRGVAVESKIVDIINQARLGGQDPGADAKERLTNLSRKVADENGLSAGGAASVLGSFQGFSSDLKGGEVSLGRLGKLAKATGTDFADMGSAAGRVNAQLMDMPEYQGDAEKRSAALLDIMRHITKQTADGSVEMSDFARYIGRIAASANFYKGTFADNIGELGALAQMAMKGGASTASEATGSAAAFARDIKKSKTESKWKEEGIDIYADKAATKLKSPQQLILEYLKKNGASQRNLAELFPNVVSQRAVQNAIATYEKAGGGAKGIEAVKGEFSKFKATIGEDDVNKLAAGKMDTTESKAQVFQNQLDRVAASMAEKLLPAMEQLAPKVLVAAESMSSLAGIIGSNVGPAIAMAITASIAKAALGPQIASIVAEFIKKHADAASAGMKYGGISMASATIGIAVGTMWVAKLDKEAKEGETDVKKSVAENAKDISDAEKEFKETGKLSPATMQRLANIQEDDQSKMRLGSQEKISNFDVINPFSSATAKEQGQQRAAAGADMELAHQTGDIDRLLQAVTNAGKPQGVQEVRVTNMPTQSLVGDEGVEGIPPE